MMGAVEPGQVKDAPLAGRVAGGLWPLLELPRPEGKLAAMKSMSRSGGDELKVSSRR
jgi:hypothetical protein